MINIPSSGFGNKYHPARHNLIVLNNRILRILQNKRRPIAVSQLYLAYNTLPINKLFEFQILIHAFNLLFYMDRLPIAFQNIALMNTNFHNYNTHTKSDFHRLSVTTATGSRISYNLCARLWNSLPVALKTITNFTVFMHSIKLYLGSYDY